MAFNVLTPVSDWVLNETKSLSPQSGIKSGAILKTLGCPIWRELMLP